MEKFDAKVDKGIFIEYSPHSKVFKVCNKINLTTKESFHVTFDESNRKPLEVEVIDCASVLEKTNLEENQEPDQGQNEN